MASSLPWRGFTLANLDNPRRNGCPGETNLTPPSGLLPLESGGERTKTNRKI